MTTLPITTIPPQSPTSLSGDQVKPLSSETANLAGYNPDHIINRLMPLASTTRCMVGTSLLVAQFLGTGNLFDQLLPPSLLCLYMISPLPWPLR